MGQKPWGNAVCFKPEPKLRKVDEKISKSFPIAFKIILILSHRLRFLPSLSRPHSRGMAHVHTLPRRSSGSRPACMAALRTRRNMPSTSFSPSRNCWANGWTEGTKCKAPLDRQPFCGYVILQVALCRYNVCVWTPQPSHQTFFSDSNTAPKAR